MVSVEKFFSTLTENSVSFFSGVPDSLLKEFCAYVTEHSPQGKHISASNEGTAVALAAGHYLATRQISLVYLQNSGLGNLINPILTLVDAEVYSIPVLFLSGWRGQPG